MQKSPEDYLLHPVYYMSKKIKQEERNYCSCELEILVIIETIKKFRMYLLGIKFKILTDCAAFQRTMSRKDLTTCVARWALLLEDYIIEHRARTRMKHVDALSRHPVMAVSMCLIIAQVKIQQNQDTEIKAIIAILKDKP